MLQFATKLRRRAATLFAVQTDSPHQTDGVAFVAPEPKTEALGWYWLQHPMVRRRVNTLISGDPHLDAYGRLAEFFEHSDLSPTLDQCATLGCGAGGLERDLAQRGLIGTIDGYDPSEDAIAEARRLAAEQGFRSIRYHQATLDDPLLPEARFDAVFTHSALHRIEALETVVANVRRALKPDGIFHLNEFVGPSRFQWSDTQLRLINDFLDTLPDRLLQTPDGRKPPVTRPAIEEMIALDPTQAARSSEIREVLVQHFDIVEERPYGGTLLHMGLGGIAQNFDMENPEDVAHLERFFDLEDRELVKGALGSDFTVLTARPAPLLEQDGQRRSVLVMPKPAPFGLSPTRQLRPPPNVTVPSGLDLTVSQVDNMLAGDDGHYLSVGQSALAAVERALGGTEPRNILDLPCGFGRVTRVLRARFPHAAITVSDLDHPGVDFSAHQFGARAAYSVRDFRELDLHEAYDLIWVGSLITHLPAEQTKRLFAALARHLAPGGTLMVTLQGPSIIPRLREIGYGLSPERAEQVIKEFERTGFGYRDYEGGEEVYGVSLTNDNYGISLTDQPWIAAALKECGLRLHAYEVQAWDNHHDIAVARAEQSSEFVSR